GDYARAEPLLQRALQIREKALGPDRSYVARALHDLALLHVDKGDYAGAEPLLQRALQIREKALGPDHPDVASSLTDLSVIHRAQGRSADAVQARQRSASIEDKNAMLNLAGGSERQKRAYMTTLAARTAQTISLHVQAAPLDTQAARLALTTILQRKG